MEEHCRFAAVPLRRELAIRQDVDVHGDAQLTEGVLDEHRSLLVLSARVLDDQLDLERSHARLRHQRLGHRHVGPVDPGSITLVGLHVRRDQRARRRGEAEHHVVDECLIRDGV